MDADLFVAILALDSYDRGYDSNLTAVLGNQIGNASVLNIALPNGSLTAGFYAVAYDWDGTTVISYRGTNFDLTGGFNSAAAKDILNGWSLFTGIGTNSQAALAQQFYTAVTESNLKAPGVSVEPGDDFIVTGHSLGGGLAGYIASRTEPSYADIFDPIPFGVSAWKAAISDSFSAALADSGLTLAELSAAAAAAAIGQAITLNLITTPGLAVVNTFVAYFVTELSGRAPTLSGISGYTLSGEVASNITLDQILGGGAVAGAGFTAAVAGYVDGLIVAALGASQVFSGILNQAVSDRSGLSTLNNPGDITSPVDLHSQALLVSYMFGEGSQTDPQGEWESEGGNTDWIAAAPYIFPNLVDAEADTLGAEVGIQSVTYADGSASASPGAQMLTEIAYSAINEGNMPFGDAAIRGLYSDADIIGAAHNNNSDNPNSYFTNSLNEIGEIVAEYAGFQAQNQEMLGNGDVVTDCGALSADYGDSSSNGLQGSSNVTSVSIDLSQQTWGNTFIDGRSDLLSSLGDEATPSFGANSNGAYSAYLTQQMDSFAGADVESNIQNVDFDFTAQTIGSTVKGLSNGFLLTVLDDSSNNVNIASGQNIVFSGNGSDTIHVSSGTSILIGGSGSDTFYGGSGSNFFYGSGTLSTFYGGTGFNEFFQSGGNTYVGKKGATKNEIVLNNYLGAERVNVVEGVIASTGQVSHFSGVQYFIGNNSHDTFFGGGQASVFVAGSAGADFHLTNGDVAVGSATGQDNFFISTNLVNGTIPKFTILNFKQGDNIYVNGTLFTGYNKTYTGYGVVFHDYNGGDPLTVLQETGQSSWAITSRKVSNPQGAGANPAGWTAMAGSDTPEELLPYKESAALYQPGEVNDVTYTAATDSPSSDAGTVEFTSSNGVNYTAGANLNIVASYGNFGSTGSIKFQTSYKYIGYYQTDNQDPYQLQTADAQTWSETTNPSSGNWTSTTSYASVIADVPTSVLSDLNPGRAVQASTSLPLSANATAATASFAASANTNSATPGGSVLTATAPGQVLAADANYNTLAGQGGGDTFEFSQGDGVVAIQEADASSSPDNALQLGQGLLASQTVVSADSSGDITLNFGGGDAVVLENVLNSVAGQTYGVQAIDFADGTVWHYSNLLANLETPSSTQTTLYGDSGANILDGKGIATTLVGNGGGDTFVYNQGYGELTITEADNSVSPDNVLQIGAGISPSSLTVTGDSSGDLILSFGGGDTITLTDGLASGNGVTYGVQEVVFADGMTLSDGDLLALADTPSATQTTLFGDSGANVLDGEGIAHTLVGGGGGDTFIFMQGYGTITIDEADNSSNPDNVLQLGHGLTESDLLVTGDASGDLILNFGGGDQVILANALNSASGITYGVQQVNFEDGTSLTHAQLLAMADTPSAGNTTLYGDTGANTLDGQGIAHTLVGNGGRDNFIFNQGYGALTIVENDPTAGDTNALQLGSGLIAADTIVTADASGDFILNFGGGDVVTIQGALNAGTNTSNGIQQVNFADGTTWTYADMLALADTGSATNTILYGDGTGDTFDSQGFATTINSKGGGDTIVYNQGYGALTIKETDTTFYPDNVIQFGAGITAATLDVSIDSSGDLVLSLGGSDQITITDALDNVVGSGVTYGIQQVNFGDGSSLTYAQLLAMADTPSATNTTLYGDGNAQTFDPMGIAHMIIGHGGSDTIVYNSGYGALLVDEADQGPGADNILQFGSGISEQDVAVSTDSSGDVVLTLSGSDQITLAKQLLSSSSVSYGVQQIEFSDGTAWSAQDLANFASDSLLVAAGSGQTVVDEATSPGGGTLPAIDFQEDSTAITVTLGSDKNSLILTASDGTSVDIEDIYNSALGNRQSIQFADGVVWTLADALSQVTNAGSLEGAVQGAQSNETFDFASIPGDGAGVKSVNGSGGNDTFIYEIGDGSVAISESNAVLTDNSTLQFGSGITLSMLTITADLAGDMILTVDDGRAADQITIDSALLGNSNVEQGVQTLTFTDGTSNTYAQMLALADTGSAQNSGWLVGDAKANVFDSAGFSHYIVGGGGGDTILYNRGYGDLYIDEVDSSSNPDNTLVLGAGIDPSQVTVQAGIDPEGLGPTGGTNRFDSLLLNIAGSGTITLAGALSDAAAGVQSVEFADGTVWTYQQMVAMLGFTYSSRFPYSGQAILVGGAGPDTLDPLGIAHYVDGNGGGDTIIYNRGYGALQIDEIDPSQDTNTLAFGAGIAPSDVTVTMSGIGQFKLSLGNGDVITFQGSGGGMANGYFQNTFEDYTNAYTGIEQVTFSDGTTWSVAQLIEQQTPGSSGILYGTAGGGIFDPRGIAQTVDSDGVNDQIIYNLGYGALTINENQYYPGKNTSGSASAPESNTVEFGVGITESMLNVTTDGTNFFISLNATDIITINNEMGGGAIQNFSFADGTTLTYADLLALADTPSASNTTLYGDANAQAFDSKGIANTIYGGGGADTFIYNQGYGALTIYDDGEGATLQLGTGLTPAGLTLSHNASDVILSFANGDSITLSGEAQGYGVDTINFGNGTVWNRATLLANVIAASPGGPVIDPAINATSLAGTADDSANDTVSSSGGTIAINDADANDDGDYTATVTQVTATGDTNGLNLSAFETQGSGDGLTFTPNYSTNDAGAFDWSFGYSNANGGAPFGYLAPGQSVTLDFQVAIADPLGRTATEVVAVTIGGVAAAPAITTGAYSYADDYESQTAYTPSSTVNSASGTIGFADPYSSPTDTVSVQDVTASGTTAGLPSTAALLSLFSISDFADQVGTGQGSFNWNFNALNTTFGYLMGGQELTLTYAIDITNDRGGTVVQDVNIYVIGAWGNGLPNTPPTIAYGTVATASVAEQEGIAGSTSPDNAARLIKFDDTNASPSDTVSLQSVSASGVTTALPSNAALLSMLYLHVITEPSGGNPGSLLWAFDAPSGTFAYLSAGEAATLTYVVDITNSAGTATQDVTLTITGTNDAPTIVAPETISTASLTEQATPGLTTADTASGTIAFADANLDDTHTASITGVTATGAVGSLPSNSALLAMLSLGTLADQAGATPGDVGWSFSTPDADFNYLSAGETVTLTYAVQISDDFGGTVTQNVAITINGTNSGSVIVDAPVITPDTTASGAIIEQAGLSGSTSADTASGTINFTDASATPSDTASVTSVSASGITNGAPTNAALLAMLSLGSVSEPGSGTEGSVAWTLDAPSGTFSYLSAGEVLTLTYVIEIANAGGGFTTQDVAVTVTGTNQAPVIATSVASATGLVVEQANPTNPASLDTAAGTIAFTDANLDDTHTATITGVTATGVTTDAPSTATLLSLLSLGSVTEEAGSAPGAVSWSFAVPDGDFAYLSAGESVTLTYAVQIADENGGTATQNVVVTVAGTNDAPVIVPTATTATGVIIEQGIAAGTGLVDTASGAIGFADTNLDDTHAASVIGVTATGVTGGLPSNGTLLSLLSLGTLTEDSGGTPGSVNWNFGVPDSDFAYLSQGETVTLNYAVQVADNHGGTVTQDVAITITGTNNAPVIASGTNATGTINKIGNATTSTTPDTVGGVIDFTDTNLDDTHSATVTAISASGATSGLPGTSELLAMLSLGGVTEEAAANPGSVNWTFAAPNSAFANLSASESITLTYTVQIADNQGGTVSENVVVTIHGAEDTPVTTVPGAQIARTATATALNGLSVSEPDDGAVITVTLSDTLGALAASASGGATVTGSASKLLTISGSVAAVDATLHSLTYTASKAGSDTITVKTGDGTTSNTQTIAETSNATVDHAPVIVSPSTITGAITKAPGVTGSTVKDTATGAIEFTDQDLTDTHTLTATSVAISGVAGGLPASSTLLTWLTKGTVTEEVGSTPGSAVWNFAATDKSFDYLSAGQTVTLTYTVKLADNHGGYTTDTVTITATGSNSAPTIASGSTVTAKITEAAYVTAATAPDTASGLIKFADVNLADTHSATVVSVSASGVTTGLVGNATLLSLLGLGTLTEESGSTPGSVSWAFSAPAADFEYLSAGQTVTLTYVVKVSDNHGGTVNENVTVTVTGSNDAPVYVANGSVEVASIAQAAVGSGRPTSETASGVIGFTDPNLADTHSLKTNSVAATGITSGLPASATILSWLKSGTITEESGSTPGSADWTFSAPSNAFDYLSAGQIVTLTYLVTLSDNHGGSLTQDVTITVTGTNDAPVIASGSTVSATITGRVATAGLTTADTAAGVIKFTDVNLADTHVASVTGVAISGTTTGLASTSTLLSWLNLGKLAEEAGTTPGSVAWSFSSADDNFDYLSVGQSVTLAYTVQVADNNGGTVNEVVTVKVNGVNYKPTAVNQTGFTTDNWTPLTISAATLLAGATDPNLGDTLTLSSVGGAVGGTVALVNGNAVFTPTATAIGVASFTYTISDGHGGTSTATVDLTTTLHDMVGTAGGTITGGAKPAELDGGAGNETVTAGSAGDILIGGAGDILYGGAGADTFVFHAGFGNETVNNFTATGTKHDTLQFDTSVFGDWANLLGATKQQGKDLLVTLDAGDSILLKNVSLSSFTSADAKFV